MSSGPSEERILNERADADLAHRCLLGAWGYAGLTLVLLFATHYPAEHPRIALAVVLATVLSAAARVAVIRRKKAMYADHPRRWRQLLSATVLAGGATWGVFAALTVYLYTWNSWTTMVVMYCVVGSCATAVMLLTPDKTLLRSNQILLMTPAIAMTVYLRNEQSLAMGGLTAAFLTFLLVNGKIISAGYWEALRAQELTRKANETKAQFLADMSHEIRTPMNGVIGMTGLLLETPLTAEQKEYAETVRKSGETLLALINDVLDFSKIEAGGLVLESILFDLRQVIEDIAELLSPLAEEAGLGLHVRYPQGLPRLFQGDAGRIRQVITNLVGNAIKFTPSGDVTVEVSSEGHGETGSRIRVAVKDTGIGIPADQIPSLFRKFAQVDSSLSRRAGGTGLGLAISKRLIELMGGQIGVESSTGVGSTFWFTLELPLAHPPAAATPSPAGAPRNGTSNALMFAHRHLRALVADDHLVNQRLTVRMLEKLGVRADVASNGVEVVDMVGRLRYDVVFMDCQMPEMSGYEAAAEIRRREAGKARRLFIVALTATATANCREECFAAGMDAFIAKPVRQIDLIEVLQHEPALPGVDRIDSE